MHRRLIGSILGTLILGACGEGTADPGRTVSPETVQVAQLRTAAGSPASLDDTLFVLWEYAGAVREVALAEAVLAKSQDAEVRQLATLVRDGHRAGMAAMVPIARDLALTLPTVPTPIEQASITAAAALPTRALDQFFLRRQRAMHAWDVTVFDDYAGVARNPRLKAYVDATRAPLRDHAAIVVDLANRKGIAGGLATVAGDPNPD